LDNPLFFCIFNTILFEKFVELFFHGQNLLVLKRLVLKNAVPWRSNEISRLNRYWKGVFGRLLFYDVFK